MGKKYFTTLIEQLEATLLDIENDIAYLNHFLYPINQVDQITPEITEKIQSRKKDIDESLLEFNLILDQIIYPKENEE